VIMDEDNRHHRRSVRREGYDYRDGGMYYVTICANDHKCVFGEIRKGVMGLNAWGSIVADELQKTPMLRPYVTLDTWIIMPNHVHIIFYLDDPAFQHT
jgi:putative transposase